ncbi:MAG: hypothetical protein ACFE7R_04745, partial [Candidatus Hodarchaeota archaeon]
MRSKTALVMILALLIPIITGVLLIVIAPIQGFSIGVIDVLDPFAIAFSLALAITNIFLAARIAPRYFASRSRLILVLLAYIIFIAI